MKKTIILASALTGFSLAVSAQQNDFFDIQKFLREKHKQVKPLQKLDLATTPSINKYTTPVLSSQLITRNFSHQLSNGDKVYTLGIDNMPCVATDMKQFQHMPNIFVYRNGDNTSLGFNPAFKYRQNNAPIMHPLYKEEILSR